MRRRERSRLRYPTSWNVRTACGRLVPCQGPGVSAPRCRACRQGWVDIRYLERLLKQVLCSATHPTRCKLLWGHDLSIAVSQFLLPHRNLAFEVTLAHKGRLTPEFELFLWTRGVRLVC